MLFPKPQPLVVDPILYSTESLHSFLGVSISTVLGIKARESLQQKKSSLQASYLDDINKENEIGFLAKNNGSIAPIHA